jgi:hypothetical protein
MAERAPQLRPIFSVMPGLVPGIHVLGAGNKDVDGRDKPGHDEKNASPQYVERAWKNRLLR